MNGWNSDVGKSVRSGATYAFFGGPAQAERAKLVVESFLNTGTRLLPKLPPSLQRTTGKIAKQRSRS